MEIIRTNYLTGKLTLVHGLNGRLSGVDTLKGTLSVPEVIAMPYYEGTYEVTPSQETQVLHTEFRSMRQDVVVNPIPEYYGLVTWNGSYLRIS